MEYQIIRSSRKTIAIQIKPNGQVIVRCPRRMRTEDIHRFVLSKTAWIEKHRKTMDVGSEAPYSPEEIRKFREITRKTVTERLVHYAPLIGVTYNRVTIRAQHTRWGSCSGRGNLNFNCLLALVPPEVLDYIVIHELCHRKEMNHSPRFWAEVEAVLPDYRTSKEWLKENGGKLMVRLPEAD